MLKQLISYLTANVECPQCKKHYSENEILILATLPSEAVFELVCGKCNVTTLVNLAMLPENKKKGLYITKKDITAMHDFLEQFNGDFKQIFK